MTLLRQTHVPSAVVTLLFLASLAGCVQNDADHRAGLLSTPKSGETAVYRLVMEGEDEQRLWFRWTESGTGRNGIGEVRSVHNVAQSVLPPDSDLSSDPDADKIITYRVDAQTGTLLSTGAWDNVDPPRWQFFASSSPMWEAFPGLVENHTLGLDLVRAHVVPLFVLSTSLAAHGEQERFVVLGKTLDMTRQDARFTFVYAETNPAASYDRVKYTLEYDATASFPLAVHGTLESGTGERPWFRLERTRHTPGDGDELAFGGGGETMAPRDRPAVLDWDTIPPEGAHALPFSIREAEDVARRDVLYRAFLADHPDAYLVYAAFQQNEEEQLLLPGSPSVPVPYAIWRLRFAEPSGDAHYLDVRRSIANGAPVDYVYFSQSQKVSFVPERALLPDKLLSLDDAMQRATVELDRVLSDFTNVDFFITTEPILVGTDHAATWTVSQREPLAFFAEVQAEFSAVTGSTLNRAHLYE